MLSLLLNDTPFYCFSSSIYSRGLEAAQASAKQSAAEAKVPSKYHSSWVFHLLPIFTLSKCQRGKTPEIRLLPFFSESSLTSEATFLEGNPVLP